MATTLYDDLDQVVKLIEVLFNLIGINIFSVNNETKLWKKRVRLIPKILIAILPLCGVTALVYDIHDFVRAIEAIFVIFCSIQITLKLWIIYKVRDDVIEFVDKCKIFRSNHAGDIEKAVIALHFNKAFAHPTIVIKIFILCYWIAISVACISPTVRSERSLPLSFYLPIGPPFKTPFYEINYGFIVTSISMGALLLQGVDAILITLGSEFCLQMHVIRYKLCNLGDDEEDDQRSKLREICQLHWEISRSVKDLNNIFSTMLLVQFSTSFVIISTSLFMFTNHHYSFLFYSGAGILQLGLYCLYGEIVKDKFEKFTFSYYDNEWYKLKLPEKKSLIISMSFAQGIPTLKAAAYVEVSMETYFQILKAAYSYLTIMQTIQSKK